MSELTDFINSYELQVLDNGILEKVMGVSIKTLNRKFKYENGFTITHYHKNYVAKNIIKTAKLEEKSIKRYFEEVISNNILTYWSDYKAFNRYRKQLNVIL